MEKKKKVNSIIYLSNLIKKEKWLWLINLSQGLIYLKEKKYDKWIKKLEAVTSRERDNAQAHHDRGQWLYEKGETEKVIESYNDSLNIYPMPMLWIQKKKH